MFRTDRRNEGSSRDSEISFSKVTWGWQNCSELFSKVSYIDLQESGDAGSKECHVCFKSLTFGVALERTVAALMLVPSARTTPAAC